MCPPIAFRSARVKLLKKCFTKYGCPVCVRSVRSEVYKQETIFLFFAHKITILLQTGNIL